MIVNTLGKILKKCSMCNGERYGMMYLWIGTITGIKLKVCRKCAIRESGSKTGKKIIGDLDDTFNKES